MQKNSEKILKRLGATYCRIMPSKINGVGVFAIRDIPKNTDPFIGVKRQKWYKFNISELKYLNKEIGRMIDDFFCMDKGNIVFIPEHGLNGMDISFFMNHSEKPNLKTIDEGFTFTTLKNIKKGEELTVSYRTYDYRYK